MSAATSKRRWRTLLISISVLAMLAGCSNRTVTTTGEDTSLIQRDHAKTAVALEESASLSESPQVTDQTFSSSVSPQAPSEDPRQPTPSNPSRLSSSHIGAAAAQQLGDLADVFFDFDQVALRPEAKVTLETDSQILKSKTNLKVLIEGHCDERGTLAYNLVLGERRAQSIKDYLRELGVPVSQISVTSYGKERPFCMEHRESCWQQNRRGHFVVQEGGSR